VEGIPPIKQANCGLGACLVQIITMKGIWKDVLKFLSGAFFVTAGASWYLSWYHIAVPLPFSIFGFTTMSPDFLGIRGFIHFGLFLICFYFGFVKKSVR
jgi:hypothetical protein